MMIILLLAGVHHRFEAINQSSVLMLQGIDGKRPILWVFSCYSLPAASSIKMGYYRKKPWISIIYRAISTLLLRQLNIWIWLCGSKKLAWNHPSV